MADKDISKFRIIDLKRELKMRGLKVTGNKEELLKRLKLTQMHLEESRLQNDRGTKRRKLNHLEVREQSSIILEMPVEIIEYIFDYLELNDLCAVSATCKQMQQLAGRVYQQNYSGLLTFFNLFYLTNWNLQIIRLEYGLISLNINCLAPFVHKMCYMRDEMTKYLNPESEFQQLKQLTIDESDITSVKFDRMRRVLSKLEYLRLFDCKTDDCSLENLLSRAANLKRLCLIESNTGQKWLERNYPTLEHCEITSSNIVPIATFLTLNPNIRRFGTNARNLWENRSLIKAAEVKLEDLSIEIRHCGRFEDLSFWELLNEFRQLGVYKRLNLYFAGGIFNQSNVDQAVNLTALKRLRLSKFTSVDYLSLSGLKYLEDISFPDSRYITDIETATKLEHLRIIHFGVSNLSRLRLFICGNLKLEKIRIDWFMDEAGKIEHEKVLNLIGLNKERAKLPYAKKITIFVQERVYLATKRATGKTDLDFIRLKRTDSLNEREFDFECPNIYPRNPF